ncbi:hypothetical protein ACES2L_05955 [Bdellovibrio bacteriovorus]
MKEDLNVVYYGRAYGQTKDTAMKICDMILTHYLKGLRNFTLKVLDHETVVENARLKTILSKECLLEVIDEWQMHWMNQDINPKDTENYRRRAMGVDANMRYGLARMINEKAFGKVTDNKSQEVRI